MYIIPKVDYTPFQEEALLGQASYRKKIVAFGREVTAVIVYNDMLEKGQLQVICINMEKASAMLLDLQQKLMLRATGEITKGRKPTVASTQKSVDSILNAEYMKRL